MFLAACLALPACKPPARESVSQPANPIVQQLAAARLDLAKGFLEKKQTGPALLLLVGSLEADPTFQESVQLIRTLLAETRWNYPAAEIDAGFPIEHARVSGNHLWLATSDPEGFNATSRWNLTTLRAEAVLFPRKREITSGIFVSPDATRLIVNRGDGPRTTSLLCDAITLKPIATLADQTGPLPNRVVFSADNLLFSQAISNAEGFTWDLRDLATGEILRSHTLPADASVVFASLNRTGLKLILDDRTQIEVPLSPLEDPRVTKLPSTDPFRKSEPPSPLIVDGSTVEIPRRIPLPKTTGRDLGPLKFNPERLSSLKFLAETLTGLHFNLETREFEQLPPSRRSSLIDFCHYPADLLPGLDFTNVIADLKTNRFRESPPDAAFVLRDRVDRASPEPPKTLALQSDAPAPPTAIDLITATFKSGDNEKILAAIPGLPAHSPAAAMAFRLALESDKPGWIAACIEANKQLPPLLLRFALSRLAWLENRKAEAVSAWRDGFPDLETSRRTEDWNGWETADFTPVFAAFLTTVRTELASYEIPETSSGDERHSIAEKLLDPSTTKAIGKERQAASCLAAARIQSTVPGETEKTLDLLTRARELGASPSECLRTEAVTHMTAENFPKAHECWISLISDFPVETHQPRDYTEAAYTAFETGNEEQALAILGTGMTRFKGNVDYAYRAGWISLLTGRHHQAYEFLMIGERVGYPDDQIEKATAMLAIAASESGQGEDARIFFDHLIAFDPSWAQPDPPKADGWPMELKAALLGIAEPPKAYPVAEMPGGPEEDVPLDQMPLPLPE
jgi:tetratricopeptide (TPR) repeat protein